MKKLVLATILVGVCSIAGAAFAVVNAPVNIAYPIAGASVKNYFTVSFSTTCPGGQNSVKWGFDGAGIGSSTFYDNFNSQFLHKLPVGTHTFDVWSSCGQERVVFNVVP